MMTVAFGAVRLGGRSWEAGIERSNSSAQVRAVSRLLRRQFAQMIPITIDNDDATEILFSGDQKRIRFIASAPRSPIAGGLIAYTLAAEEFDDGQRLVLAHAPYDPGASGLSGVEPGRQLILADGFVTISFEFFGKKVADSRPSWQADWSADEETLPELVRITLVAANDAVRWPELILNIRAEYQS